MRILSLDASTSATGWAIWEDGELLDSGCFRPNSKLSWEARSFKVAGFVADQQFDMLVMEDVPLQRNGLPTLAKLCVLSGMIRFAAGNKVYLFQPNKWRSKAGLSPFKKHRDELKQAAVDKVNELYNLDLALKDNDRAEAIMIGIAYKNLRE